MRGRFAILQQSKKKDSTKASTITLGLIYLFNRIKRQQCAKSRQSRQGRESQYKHCLLLQTISLKCLRCYLDVWRKTPFVCMPIGVKTETDTQKSNCGYEALRLQWWNFLGSSLCLSGSRCSKHSRPSLIALWRGVEHNTKGQHSILVLYGVDLWGEKKQTNQSLV